MKQLSLILTLVVLLCVTGCAMRDRRDAPHDPKGSAQLIDQLPNWNNKAALVCCGHKRTCAAHESPRC